MSKLRFVFNLCMMANKWIKTFTPIVVLLKGNGGEGSSLLFTQSTLSKSSVGEKIVLLKYSRIYMKPI